MLRLIFLIFLLSWIQNCSKNNSYVKSPSDVVGGGGDLGPAPTAIEPGPTKTPAPTFSPTFSSTPTYTPSPTNVPNPVDCDFETYQDHVPAGCVGHPMTVGGVIVADAEEFSDRIHFIATKKNGGTGGSRWYDARITLGIISNILLPVDVNIVAGGNAGNGQKLYFIFDNTVICSYRSVGSVKYANPICKLGGVIDPTKPDGFATGMGTYQPDNTRVNNFKILQVTVNGASGGGVVTKVNFDVFFD